VAGALGDAVWMTSIANFYPLAAVGALVDHRPLMSAAKYDTRDFYASMIQGVTVGGKICGLPDSAHSGRSAVYYNKSAFDQAGLAYPAPEWTYDTFLTAARSLTRAGERVAFEMPKNLFGAVVFLRSFGGDFLNADGKKQGFDAPPAIEALQFIADLHGRHRVAATAADLPGGRWQSFNSGSLAMFQDGSFSLAGVRQNAAGVSWGVVPMPRGRAGSRSMMEFNALGVTRFSRHPGPTFDFVAFMASEEVGLERVRTSRGAGARRSVWEHPETVKDPELAMFGKLMETTPGLAVPANARYLDLRAAVEAPLAPLWGGSPVDAKTVAGELAQKTQYVLDQPRPTG
jgi:multiple sugar transport system substrate-binding protein